MSETKTPWTPGEWVADEYGVIFTAGEGRFMLGSFNMMRPNQSVGSEREARANGKLGAAAPDLFGALQAVVNAIMEGDDQSAFQIAKNAGTAALAKARGDA